VTALTEATRGSSEAYTYDIIGNLVSMSRTGEGTWSYEPAPFSEPPSRSSTLGVDDLHTWDDVGRLTGWVTDDAGDVTVRSYTYDGAGRLSSITSVPPPPGDPTETMYAYDVDDALVYETRDDGHGPPAEVFRVRGYRKDTDTGQVIEKVLPMLAVEDAGDARWTLVEPDGHALATYESTGSEASFEVAGVYGKPLDAWTRGSTWPIDGFHGSDPDRGNEVVHFGARHMVLRDGMWMQPEPLLYMGPARGDLAHPRGYGGVYASGNPLAASDRSGRQELPTAEDAEEAMQTVHEIGLSVLELVPAADDIGAPEWLESLLESAADLLAEQEGNPGAILEFIGVDPFGLLNEAVDDPSYAPAGEDAADQTLSEMTDLVLSGIGVGLGGPAGSRGLSGLDDLASQAGPKLLTKSWGLADFAPGKLERHFADHAAEWGAGNITNSSYLSRARSLLGSEPSGEILGFTREGGDILRYNTRTNEFAVGSSEGTIRTLFRPEDGIEYWYRQTGGAP
jgi:YD repeat-containing protein